MAAEEIRYPELVREALRLVVRQVLEQVAEEGLPGDHYFYLTFRTGDPGVEIPAALKRSHPESMTVVLQHQFWDLAVDQEGLGVTLRFGGARERLRIPFRSLTHFVDPNARFALAFEAVEQSSAGPGEGPSRRPSSEDSRESLGQAEVISFEDFKKK